MSTRRGFTLIEVLVVVAIIALLISILMPSLARARAETRSVVCRSNMRQVMQGQLLYAHDHKRLPATISTFYEAGCGSPGLTFNDQLKRRELFTWEGAHGVSNANKSQLVPGKGTILRYIKDKSLYVCPADEEGAAADVPEGGGGNGFLSYSMNAYLGWKDPDFRAFRYLANEGGLDPDGNYKRFEAGQTVVFNASTTFVLAEEHPKYNINSRTDGGGYGSGYGEGNFNVTDRIATRHSPALGPNTKGRTNLAFLDGHAETRLYHWTTIADQLFREIGEPVVTVNRRAFLAPCRLDECPE